MFLNINSTGSSSVKICSLLVSFIASSIDIREVDFQEPVGQVTNISHCFAFINLFTQRGSQSFSIGIGSDAILLNTNANFHNLKKAFTLKGVPSVYT